jgi:membrane protease YdiL (CAAX protease family)
VDPGWYADPYERLRFRWWDGASWTAYAADDAVQWDEVPEEAATRPPGPRGIGIALAGYGVGVGLAFVIELVLVALDRPGGRAVELILSQLGLWSGLLGACLYVSKRRGTGSFATDFGWQFRRIDAGLGLAGSIAGRVVAGVVVAPIPVSFRHVRAPDRSVFERVAHGPAAWITLIAIVCVGAPLIEELFFRGLLQTRLVDVAGPAGGIVIASVLFGAAHMIAWQGWVTVVYAIAIAGGGLVLGLMRHVSSRLGPGIAAHAFFNAQAVVAAALLQ